MAVDVTISFNSAFGTRGSGVDQFDYPSGVVVAVGNLYICDRQNHRVKILDLSGNYISEFGSYGSGNDEFSLPEGITTDGSLLYIADSGNNRIKIHSIDGMYIDQFGTEGDDTLKFKHPTDITYKTPYLYVADRGNSKIKYYTTAKAYVGQWSGLYLNEGVTSVESNIVVADSANKLVKIYDLVGNLQSTITNTGFVYPTSVDRAEEVLIVIDNQGSTLYFYNLDGTLIDSFDTGLFFPDSVYYYDGKLYLTDSANHRVIIYNFFITREVPAFAPTILKLTKQLYPTGRAWIMKFGSTFEKIHDALSYSEARAYKFNLDILNAIIPDNDGFTVENATDWERALGLFDGSALSLDDRKLIIARKLRYPGNIKARQHRLYLQGQLQAAGFDVYVHEYNDYGVNPNPSIHNEILHGNALFGGVGLSTTKIANYINEYEDSLFVIGGVDKLKYTFYIGGETFPARADVPLIRRDEFRDLILKIKPAHTGGWLLIDYI